MRRSSRPVLALAVALSLGTAACGGGEGSTARLEENLEAQRAALDALQTRVSELADEVGEVAARDPMTGLGDLTDQLEGLTTRLEDVESSVSDAAGDEDVTAVVAAEVGRFSEQLDELVASVRDLTTVVNGVRGDVEELERRFDEHRSDPFAHDRGSVE